MGKSVSQWYPRYVGDYMRKTRHLSMMEHGAYAMLMDWYYTNGCGPDANASVLHRVCMAFADDEQAAVQSVLNQFFRLVDGRWINDRAEEELIKRGKISKQRQTAADTRWGRDANAYPIVDAHASHFASISHNTSTSTEEEGGGGSASAREAEPDDHEDILLAAGIDPTKDITGKWYSSTQQHTVRQWRVDLRLTQAEILEEITSIQRGKTGPPGSLNYFTEAMRRVAGRKSEPRLEPAAVAQSPPPRRVIDIGEALRIEARRIEENEHPTGHTEIKAGSVP